MSYLFACSQCGREMKTDERHVGRKVRCPGCETLLVIPPPEVPEPEPEPQSESEPVELMAAEEPSGEATTEDYIELQPVEPPPPPPTLVPADERHAREKGARMRFKGPPPVEPPLRPVPQPPAAKAGESDHPPLLLRPHRHPEDLIDMTAMVDIVFFLLIFFLVTSLQSIQAVMDLPTPQSASGAASKVRTITEFENDPTYIIVRIEDDDSIWVEDTQVFNDQDLRARLRAARQEDNRPRSLLVIGDADASHGAAVRVFDAGAGAGVAGISLLVQEKAEGGA